MSFIKQPTWWQRMLPWLGLAIGIILIDQLTKITIEQRFEFGDVKPVTGFFNVVLAYNKGAAFSFLASASGWQGGFLIAIAVAASVFILYLLARHGHQRLFALALAMIPRERLFLVEPKLTTEGIKDQGAKTRVDFSLK